MNAASWYQHLQWRLNRAFLDESAASAEHEQLAAALYRLLVLYLFHLRNADRGVASAHLLPKQIEEADPYMWVTSNIGPLSRKDTLNAELRSELKRHSLEALIEKYRAVALRDDGFSLSGRELPAKERPAAEAVPRLPIAKSPTQRREDLFNLLGSIGASALAKIRVMSAHDESLEKMVVTAEAEGFTAEQVDQLVRVVTV